MTESPSVYSETQTKARKHHKCIDCGGEIAVGKTYVVIKGCWDGEWRTYRQCVPCNSAFSEAINEHVGYPEDGPYFGGVWDWWRERFDTDEEFEAFKAWYLDPPPED